MKRFIRAAKQTGVSADEAAGRLLSLGAYIPADLMALIESSIANRKIYESLERFGADPDIRADFIVYLLNHSKRGRE